MLFDLTRYSFANSDYRTALQVVQALQAREMRPPPTGCSCGSLSPPCFRRASASALRVPIDPRLSSSSVSAPPGWLPRAPVPLRHVPSAEDLLRAFQSSKAVHGRETGSQGARDRGDRSERTPALSEVKWGQRSVVDRLCLSAPQIQFAYDFSELHSGVDKEVLPPCLGGTGPAHNQEVAFKHFIVDKKLFLPFPGGASGSKEAKS